MEHYGITTSISAPRHDNEGGEETATTTAAATSIASLEGHTSLSLYSLFYSIGLRQQIQLVSRQLASLLEEWGRIYEWSLRRKSTSHPALFYIERFRQQLYRVCQAPGGDRVPQVLLQVIFMFLIGNIVFSLEARRGKDSAVFFLCMIDVWIILPLSRYVYLFRPQSHSPIGTSSLSGSSEANSFWIHQSNDIYKRHPDMQEANRDFDPILIEKRQLIDELVRRMFLQLLDYIYYEYPWLTRNDLRWWIDRVNSRLVEDYSLDRRPLFELREEGFFEMLADTKEVVYQLLSPAFHNATRFVLDVDLPKFIRGFLEKFNETVVVYLKFMKRRETLSPHDEDIDLIPSLLDLIYKELQKDGDLHFAIALSENPMDIQREEEYLANIVRKFKRGLFPTGVLARLLELTTACCADVTRERLGKKCSRWESYLDMIIVQQAACQLRIWLDRITQAHTINQWVVESIRRAFPEVYEEVFQSIPATESPETTTYELANQMIRAVVNHYLDDYKVVYGINWLNSPLRYIADFDSLLLESASQLFEFMQNQFFVKTWLYKNLDFIVGELVQNSLNVEYQKARVRLRSSLHPRKGIQEIVSGEESTQVMDIFDPNEKKVMNAEGFVSLFEYLRGTFATELAKNSVSLIAFKTRSKWLNRSAWSASLGNLILQLSSNLYGMDEAVGQFIISCIEETIGGQGLNQIGSMEDIVLATCQSLLASMTLKTASAKDIHDLYYGGSQVAMMDLHTVDSPEKGLAQFIDKIPDESTRIKMGQYIQWRLSMGTASERDHDILNSIWTSLTRKFHVDAWRSRHLTKWQVPL
jgi:hypothetical protein